MAKEECMEPIEELGLLYIHLEMAAIDYKYSFEIGRQFQRCRDKAHTDGNVQDRDCAQWEIDVFNFVLSDGKAKSQWEGSDSEGNIKCYPTIEGLSDAALDYLNNRLDTTSNPRLRARYAHILWESPRKHQRYAKAAIDSYMHLISLWESRDQSTPGESYGLKVLSCVKNALSLSLQTDHRVSEIKAEVHRLLAEFSPKSSSWFALVYNLIEHSYKNRKAFTENELKALADTAWSTAAVLVRSGRLDNSISCLEFGVRIVASVGQDTTRWWNELGRSNSEMMDRFTDTGNLACVTYCLRAVDCYGKAGNAKEVARLNRIYAELRGSGDFQTIRKEVDLSDHLDRCRELALGLASKGCDEVLMVLTVDKYVLPQLSDMEKMARVQAKNHPLLSLISVQPLDDRGNAPQSFDTEEERHYFSVLQNYAHTLRLDKQHLINEIFFAAINKSVLSADTFLDFLRRHSWYGKTITQSPGRGIEYSYNWLSFLAPPIMEYFEQIGRCHVWSDWQYNMVMCIDSAVLKLEGLLRELCQFNGIRTHHVKKDNKGRQVTSEMHIQELLYMDEVKKLFDEDELLFLRFLLVEKVGYNLRHRVAHSLMRFEEYSYEYMHLILLAFLKLGKYDFVDTHSKGAGVAPT